MEWALLLTVLGIAGVVALAVVLVVAMVMPPSRQQHTQSVLGIIPRTVLAWRGLRNEEGSGAKAPELEDSPPAAEDDATSAESGTESHA